MKALFRVKGGFWLGGIAHWPGEEIEIDDPAVINSLMGCDKIAPANAETTMRLKSRSKFEWTKGQVNVSNERLRFVNI